MVPSTYRQLTLLLIPALGDLVPSSGLEYIPPHTHTLNIKINLKKEEDKIHWQSGVSTEHLLEPRPDGV